MKKLKLSLIALTAAVALFATSAQAASYGMDGRYDPFAPQIGSNQRVVNYTTDGRYLSAYSTNFALYNYKGDKQAYTGVINRYWEPKRDTVHGLTTPSTEGANQVYNYDEYGNALPLTTDFSQYNYLGDDQITKGVVYRFWSQK